MICTHCGYEYADNANYCPKCAEPKPVVKQEPTMEEKVKERENLGLNVMWWMFNILAIIMSLPFLILAPPFGIAIVAFFVVMSIFIRNRFNHIKKHHKPEVTREAMIAVQYAEDDTSICPHCGSHDIALGRKGYDWGKGFWYNLFGTPGAGYVAGMDSRKVTCYCQHCGHKWVSKQEWIK